MLLRVYERICVCAYAYMGACLVNLCAYCVLGVRACEQKRTCGPSACTCVAKETRAGLSLARSLCYRRGDCKCMPAHAYMHTCCKQTNVPGYRSAWERGHGVSESGWKAAGKRPVRRGQGFHPRTDAPAPESNSSARLPPSPWLLELLLFSVAVLIL